MGDRLPFGHTEIPNAMSFALAHPPDTLAILALALAIEAAFGYPDALYRALGHPVTWIGRLIAALDRGLNRGSARARRLGGVLALQILVAVVGAVALGLTALAGVAGTLPAIVLLAFASASLPAQRSLDEHVARVAEGLRAEGLVGGRRAVAMIVGRDPETLDEAGICRAAIESLSENFSDGIVAPAFWIGLGGLPGGALYKAINTADSMVGHRTPRHEAFGWASARLDEVVHLATSSTLRAATPQPVARLEDTPFALVVGDPTTRKNLRTVMAAWPAVRARHPDAVLAIAGPPSWGRTELGELFERLVADGAVVALGHIDDAGLRWAYEHAQVVLCPSLAEGYGLPAAEALDLGAPVIISDDPAMQEVCAGRARAVLPALDVAAWSGAVADALDTPRLTRPASGPGTGRTWADVAEESVRAVRRARER